MSDQSHSRPATRAKKRRAARTARPLRHESLERRDLLAVETFLPVAGDWDGDGRDSLGLFDPASNQVYLRDINAPGFPHRVMPTAAPPAGSVPIAIDANRDGRDEVNFAPSGSAAALSADFDGDGDREAATFDRAHHLLLIDGQAVRTLAPPVASPNAQLLLGDWSGRGRATPGWYEPATGLFTPWHTWHEDPLAAPLFAVPSTRVQSHVDLPISRPWQNARGAFDVDGDNLISSVDAVLVLNAVNAFGPRTLPAFRGAASAFAGFLDTSGDDFLSPLDALLVINRLNVGDLPTSGEPMAPLAAGDQLSEADVELLLKRASAASNSQDAIIAIVDRGGRILGVRTEASVVATYAGRDEALVFAIDGAVAKARTAAFFSSNEAPLTSRTVRFISQSTVTQREVQSNPNIGDFSSSLQGPGFVAPIGTGGHFPPGVNFTPPVDLFAIEHTNRDSVVHPGVDAIKGTADDLALASRFNIPLGYIPPGQGIEAPESYGFTSGLFADAQSRGIATLPGGMPLSKYGQLVGGIGVFFPGPDGYATFEQSFVAGVGQTEHARTNASKVLEAEWIAFATAGGVDTSQFPNAKIDAINGIALPAGIRLPFGRIDLGGITLEIYGPNPTAANPARGVDRLLSVGASVLPGGAPSGSDRFVTSSAMYREGVAVPAGWLVVPHGSGTLATADVERMIMQGVAEANLVRAAIRLPIGERTSMVFGVSDKDGNVLGLYRMPDATVFSIDVAVAKARNEAYYADPMALHFIDQFDENGNAVADVPAGVAMTARTFRFLAEPRFPAGIDGTPPGPFSILNEPGINPATAENIGAPLPASVYMSEVGFDAFHVGRNFRDSSSIGNQNGIVFFPGSTPIYVGGALAGGLGVSGDGVDQDDVVTFYASVGYQTPQPLRADQYYVRGVRLPFQKFLRNPHG